MIDLDGIDVSYGNIQVVWDLDFRITEDDTVVSIVGPNGAGKSTLLRVMSGLHPVDNGTVTVWGTDAAEVTPTEIVEQGFVHVSEERNLFGDMTVRENLEMGAYTQRESLDDTIREVFELFPVLEERSGQLAQSMSGGQQQMLAIGRGLMAQPRILALDEPSEGLAPQITDRVFEKVGEISEEPNRQRVTHRGAVYGAARRGGVERHRVCGSFRLEALRRRTPVRPGDTVSADVGIPAIHASEGGDDRGYVDIELQVKRGPARSYRFGIRRTSPSPGPAATRGPLTDPADHRYRGASR